MPTSPPPFPPPPEQTPRFGGAASGDILKRGFSFLRDSLSTLGDFLARLTAWQFVGLCVLLMIAAGISNDILERTAPKPPRTPIVIEKEHWPGLPKPPKPPGVKDGESSANPSGDEKSVDIPQGKEKIEIRIGDEGIVVRGSDDIERLARKIEKRIDRDEEDDDARRGVNLPQLAFLLIILLLIVRMLSKSKIKAEAATAAACDLAEREALSRQLAEARLQAMQAQVEPHFLFNTLAAVEHLIETDPPRAAQMQRNLIGYLRSVLPNFRKPESTLGREVEICRHYLEILKMRMEDRLAVEIAVPPQLENARMPPLMLQSIVENAIRHGLEPKPEGGQLYLGADLADDLLSITVVDTGIGFSGTGKPQGSGVGLANIRERLVALFGQRGRLTITPNRPTGTQVRLEIPYEVENR
jgi:hypothetical protein